MGKAKLPPSFGEKVTEGDTPVHVDQINYVEDEDKGASESHPKKKEIKKLKRG